MRIAVDAADLERLEVPTPALGAEMQLLDRSVYVGAVTHGIRSFTVVPYLFADPHEARRILGLADGQATFWAIDLARSACASAVRASLERHADLAVRDRGEFEHMTSRYWVIGSGAGATLAFAALLGFIVGLVVVGQTLYSLTESRSRELATLKAMGAKNSMVVRVILAQAMISAAFGFVAGSVLAIGMRTLMAKANLTVALFPSLYAATLVVTIAMCSFAALLSIVKVLRLDPASVFKG
jgi:putative ABC transport system permease protein